jgi:hypothetical protein
MTMIAMEEKEEREWNMIRPDRLVAVVLATAFLPRTFHGRIR